MDRRRQQTSRSHKATSQKIDVKLIPLDASQAANRVSIIEFLKEHHTTDPKHFPDPEQPFNKYNFYFLFKPSTATMLGVSCYSRLSDHLAITRFSCIHKDHRGQGYGRLQSDCLEQEIRKAGFGKIFCEIYSDNLANLNLKLSQGFQIEGFHKSHFDKGRDEYSLGKILT